MVRGLFFAPPPTHPVWLQWCHHPRRSLRAPLYAAWRSSGPEPRGKPRYPGSGDSDLQQVSSHWWSLEWEMWLIFLGKLLQVLVLEKNIQCSLFLICTYVCVYIYIYIHAYRHTYIHTDILIYVWRSSKMSGISCFFFFPLVGSTSFVLIPRL